MKTNIERLAERLLDMTVAEVESVLAMFSTAEREVIVAAICDGWHGRNAKEKDNPSVGRADSSLYTKEPTRRAQTNEPIKLWQYQGLVYVIRDGVLHIFPKMLDALIYLEIIRTLFTPRYKAVTVRDHLHPVTSLCDPTPIVKRKVIHIRIGEAEAGLFGDT